METRARESAREGRSHREERGGGGEGAESACLALGSVAERLAGSTQRDGLAHSGGRLQVMLSARRETCPRVTFSGAGTVTVSLRVCVRLSAPLLRLTVLQCVGVSLSLSSVCRQLLTHNYLKYYLKN